MNWSIPKSSERLLLVLIPLYLFPVLVVPYGLIVPELRGLKWVWEAGYKPFWILMGIASIGVILSSAMLWYLNRIGVYIYYVTLALLIVHATWIAMPEKRHFLLVIIFVLLSVGVFFGQKIKNVLNEPYFDSNRNWWESFPRALPGIEGTALTSKDEEFEIRVTNIGLGGCFVFLKDHKDSKKKVERVSLRIAKGDPKLFSVKTEHSTWDRYGIGLRFLDLTPDDVKELSDHLLQLKRAGYEIQV